MQAKKRLAWELVAIFDGNDAAEAAAQHFERVHQERQLPDEMPSLALSAPTSVVEVIHAAGFAESKGAARRLVQQGAVRLDGETVRSIDETIEPGSERVLQVGKRRFLRLP